MINHLAEGRTYHQLIEFLDNFEEKYKYSFTPAKEALTILGSFRYKQEKLASGTIKLYPKQLITLARYYMYHHELGDTSKPRTKNEVRKLLIIWMDKFYTKVNELSKYYVTQNVIRGMTNSSFQLPLFSNKLPVDAILTEAETAGPLDKEGYNGYPDPTGLPFGEGKYMRERKPDEDENTFIRNFWEAQLTALTDKTIENPNNVDQKEFTKSLLSRSVRTMFIISIWYAQNYHAFEKNLKKIGMSAQDDSRLETPKIYLERDQFERGFAELASPKNFEKVFDLFSDYASRLPFPEYNINAFSYTYKDPEKIEEIYTDDGKGGKRPVKGAYKPGTYKVKLPEWSELDSGGRICDSSKFYEISLEMLSELTKNESPLLKVPVKLYVRFENIHYGNKFDNIDDIEKDSVGKDSPPSSVEYRRWYLKMSLWKLIYNYYEDFKKAVDADVLSRLRKIDTNSDNNIINQFKKLNLSKNPPGNLLLFIKKMSKSSQNTIFELEKQAASRSVETVYSNLAEVLARTYTMLSMIIDENGENIFNKELIFWDPVKHLIIDEKYLNKENEIKNILSLQLLV